MLGRWMGSGQWKETSENNAMGNGSHDNGDWAIGLIVDVCARTWVGINRPGGTGRITKIHFADDGKTVQYVDVKYTVSGGCDHNVPLDLVTPYKDLAPRGRSRTYLPSQLSGVENQVNRRARSRSQKPTIKKKRTPTKQPPEKHMSLSPPKRRLTKKKSFVRRATAIIQSAVSPSKMSLHNEVAFPFPTPTSNRTSNRDRQHISPTIPKEIFMDDRNRDSPESHLSMPTILSPRDSEAMKSPPGSSCNTTDRNKCWDGRYNDMECDNDNGPNDDKKQRQHSPTYNRLMEARSMAKGRMSLESDPSDLMERIAFDDSRLNGSSKDRRKHDRDEIKKNPAIKHLPYATLREVFDDGYRKASQFIEDVVATRSGSVKKTPDTGLDNHKEDDSGGIDNNEEILKETDNRLSQFHSQLNELLLESDGMIEETQLSEQMSDFTEVEVSLYLTQLSLMNKIMHSKGWIYII